MQNYDIRDIFFCIFDNRPPFAFDTM
jgi:hypothetical protein